jgi:hypothetical protein
MPKSNTPPGRGMTSAWRPVLLGHGRAWRAATAGPSPSTSPSRGRVAKGADQNKRGRRPLGLPPRQWVAPSGVAVHGPTAPSRTGTRPLGRWLT